MSKLRESRDAAGTNLYCEIDGSPVTLLAEDLSTAGFFVETTTPKAIDREVEIVVRSVVGELHALGQVVQVVDGKRARAENRRAGYGLLFTSLEDDQRAFIGLTLDAIARSQRAQAKAEQRSATAATRAQAGGRPPPSPAAAKPSLVPPSASGTPRHELEQIATDLRAELTKLQGKTSWTALGLEADSPLDLAKEAFLRVSKRFHPHKFARHNSPEISELATEVFIAYKRAYSVLTKLATRTSATSLRDAQRATRTLSSLAPAAAAAASIRPAAPKPAGNRPRSR